METASSLGNFSNGDEATILSGVAEPMDGRQGDKVTKRRVGCGKGKIYLNSAMPFDVDKIKLIAQLLGIATGQIRRKTPQLTS